MRVLPTSIKSITSKIAAVVLGCSMLVAPGLIASAQAVTTPSTLVTFETTDTTGYALGAGADFNGNTSSLSTTPPAGGSTGSAQSAKVITGATNAGTTFLNTSTASINLVSTAHKVVTVNVYAPDAGKVVRLKVEQEGDVTKYVEKDVTTTLVGWQTMTFDYTTPTTAPFDSTFNYNKASFFFDFGGTVTGGTWYFDDVAFNGASTPAPTILGTAPTPPPALTAPSTVVTFESSDTSGYAFTNDWSGAISSVSNTPPAGGSAGSAFAGKVIKGAGDFWSGSTFLDTNAANTTLLDSAHKVVTINVYAPEAGKIVDLKIETHNGSTNVEKFATTTTVGWQTLTFDFSGALDNNSPAFSSTAAYQKASILFSFATGFTVGAIWYFDDVTFNTATSNGGGGGGGSSLTSATMRLTNPLPIGGTNAYDATSSIYHGAGATQNNAGDKAYIMYHARGATYSYTWQAKDQGGNPIANHAITLDVHPLYSGTTANLSITASSGQTSANPGVAVTVTPVNNAGGGAMSTVSGTTDANGYVTFNVTNTDSTGGDPAPTNIFDAPIADTSATLKTNMYPTLGLGDANEAVDISWDHFTAAAGGSGGGGSTTSPSTLVNFESGDTSGYVLGNDPVNGDFGGAISSRTTTAPTGGSVGSTAAAQVLKPAKAAGWAGTTFLNTSGASATLVSSAHKVVTVNVYAPAAGKVVRLKVEQQGDTNKYVEKDVTTSAAGWQTLSFDFASPSTAPFDATFNYNKASFFFDFNAALLADETWFFDDVAFNGAITPALATSGGSTLPAVANIYLTSADRLTMTDKSAWWTNEAASFSRVKMLVAGSQLVLHYLVTDGSGTPVANTLVTLTVAKVGVGNFTGTLTGTTDSQGAVTFTLTNTNTDAQSEPYPTSPSTINYWDDSRSITAAVEEDFTPSIGAATEHIDRVWVHAVAAQNYVAAIPVANIHLSSSDISTMTNKNYWWSSSSSSNSLVKFVVAGSQLVLHYTVTDGTGAPIVGKVVTLGETTAGGTPTFTGTLTGTTDASGNVTFTLTNTNATGEPYPVAPSSITFWDDTRGALISSVFTEMDFVPTVGAQLENTDRVWSHVVTAQSSGGGGTPPPSSTMVNPTIRLTSPSSFAWTDSATAATWVGNTWYYTGLRYGGLNEQVGSTFALTYHVTDDQGHAAASKTVTLKINKQYSNSTANFTGYPASSPDGSLTGTTDASGNVTFHLTNTNTTADTCSTSAITAPPAGPLYSQITAWINGQATDAIDITDVNIYGCIVTIPSVLPTSRVQATGLLGLVNNDSADSGWAQYYASGLHYFHAYIYQGSTVKLSWHVTDSTGGAAANTAVTLLVNKGCSASTATWSTSVGAVGPVGNGNSPCVDGARVAGTTDASGNITFIFQDTSASGEASSTSTSIVDPTTPGVYGQFALQVGTYSAANAESLDIVDLHILALPSLPSAAGATSTTAPTHVPPTDTTHATTDINGTPTTTATTPNVGSSSVDIVVAGITVTVSGSSDTGTTEPLMPDSSLQVPASGTTNIAAGGFQDSTMVDVYVHSALIYLGRFPTDSSGHLTAAFRIPASLAIGGHTLQIVGLTAGGATVSLAIPITVVQTVAQAAAASSASTSAAAYAVWLAKQPAPVKATVGARASITSDVKAKTISCSVPATTGSATMAIYYLFVNRHLISAKRFGSLITSPLYPQIDAAVSGADLNSATWAIASSWNTGHIATIGCTVQVGNSMGVVISQSASAVLPRVGKYTGVSSKSAPAPTAVTMRLVSPVMTRDASGKAVDFVDESASPVQDHWSQYYGNANGGLGVFYKYFTAGSTLTLKYRVTDSVSKAALSYYSVWLNVNKNYGGVETATFSYLKNGIAYQIAGHSTDLGETQIPGITDANGEVTFILVNTNDPKSAEPKPAALDQIQPTTVSTTVFSTITLMAHLSPTSETKETKDFIWAHFVQP